MKQTFLNVVLITVALLSVCSTIAQSNTITTGLTNKDTFSVQIADGRQMLSEIMTVVGLRSNFELKEAKVANIEASILNRKRYILYNPAFIIWINKATKDKWAAFALLAHEVGHHLNGHTIRKSGSTPKLELEADEFAGFVLRKLGASLEQSQEVMKYIARTEASKTHPSRTSRMLAIENGWSKASISDPIIGSAKR